MGQSKPLLPFGGRPLIGALIDTLESAAIDSILVVTRENDASLVAWLATRGIACAVNPRPERGMLSSLWAGIEALGGGAGLALSCDALLVTPADHPSFAAATVRRLLAAVRGGAALALPVFERRRGHPLVIASELIPEVLDLDLDQGLRQLVERHREEVAEVPVEDAGVVRDIDTPEDYRRALAEHDKR